MPSLRVTYEILPLSRWSSLFHVLLLERPETRLEWLPLDFPRDDRPLLEGADVGLFVEPPHEPGLETLNIGSSSMAVLMAAGHRLARHHELRVADVLEERFLDAPHLHPAWKAFWSLDAYRGGPPRTASLAAANVQHAIAAIARGDAIGTFQHRWPTACRTRASSGCR